jgi:lipopolysaccharide export system ATP-binding protein
MATSPSFILLDEPFTGIDPIEIHTIQQIVAQLKSRGVGILITDHTVRETLATTDRAYIVKDGKIMTSGTSDEVARDPIARKYYLGEHFEL